MKPSFFAGAGYPWAAFLGRSSYTQREARATRIRFLAIATHILMDQAQQASRRLLSGLCIEQKLPDRKLLKHWQDAVQNGEFDSDACADEILEDVGEGVRTCSELLARAGGLQRDFLMMPLQSGARGAVRKAKRKGKGFIAYLIANLVAISTYSLILAAMAILLRQKKGWSYDEAIDGLIRFVTDLF